MRAAMKLLVVTPEPIDAAALRSAAGPGAEEAEVLVVTPATHQSGLRFWMSDPDPAIERAEGVAQESAERMEEEGVDAVGETGESDPLLAVQDALATFDADEIVLCTHAAGEDEGWLETGVVEEIKRRYSDLPVRQVEISTAG